MNTNPGTTTLDAAWAAVARLKYLDEDVASLAEFLDLPKDTPALLVFSTVRDIVTAFRVYCPERDTVLRQRALAACRFPDSKTLYTTGHCAFPGSPPSDRVKHVNTSTVLSKWSPPND
jgi:hypothetical protein